MKTMSRLHKIIVHIYDFSKSIFHTHYKSLIVWGRHVLYLFVCLQFKEEVEKGNTGFCLPYKMDKGRIEDTSTGTAYSIKLVLCKSI